MVQGCARESGYNRSMGKSLKQQVTHVQLGVQHVSSLATKGTHTALAMGTQEFPVMTISNNIGYMKTSTPCL